MNVNHEQSHQKVWALLPWHANGTLDVAESRAVDRHLTYCLICRREILALSELSAAVSQREEDIGCDNALARLHDRLDNQSEPNTIPWAVAASLVLMMGLAFLTSFKVTDGLLDFGDGYQTLGTPRAGDTKQLSTSARIVFRQDIGAANLVSLLDGVDATIATGPSRRGAYTIKFSNTISSEEQQQAISILRSSGQVLFVEPAALTLNERFYR